MSRLSDNINNWPIYEGSTFLNSDWQFHVFRESIFSFLKSNRYWLFVIPEEFKSDLRIFQFLFPDPIENLIKVCVCFNILQLGHAIEFILVEKELCSPYLDKIIKECHFEQSSSKNILEENIYASKCSVNPPWKFIDAISQWLDKVPLTN